MTAGTTVPAPTASYSGFVNGDTNASLTVPPTLSTTATPASAAGSVSHHRHRAGSPNYMIAYVAGTLTISDELPPAVVALNPEPRNPGSNDVVGHRFGRQ